MDNFHSPANIFRFCPACGSPDFTPDTEKSMKCSSCGFRYFFNMSASVAAIIRNDKNEVLFTMRKHDPAAGKLDLPGGFVDLGETAEEAVVREVYEELNLKISQLKFLRTYTNTYLYGGIEYQTLDLVFEGKVDTFLQIQAADDVSGYVFRYPAAVKPEEIGLDSIREIVRAMNDGI